MNTYWKSQKALTGEAVPLVSYYDEEAIKKRRTKVNPGAPVKPKYVKIKTLDLSALRSRISPSNFSTKNLKTGFRGVKYV